MHRDRIHAQKHRALVLLAPAVAARMSLRTAIRSARPGIYPVLFAVIVVLVFGYVGAWLSTTGQYVVEPLDPWGTRLEMVCASSVGQFGVVSAGPGRRFRTVDDIDSWGERR